MAAISPSIRKSLNLPNQNPSADVVDNNMSNQIIFNLAKLLNSSLISRNVVVRELSRRSNNVEAPYKVVKSRKSVKGIQFYILTYS